MLATAATDHDAGPLRLRGDGWVAEDNAVHRLVINPLLIRLGLQVSLVHDGQQALEAMEEIDAKASTDPPDLMLMDLQMPVLDGYRATEKIRQWAVDKQRPRLPIMARTADAFAKDKQRCLAVGMDGFLTKPVDFNDWQAVLSQSLTQVGG